MSTTMSRAAAAVIALVAWAGLAIQADALVHRLGSLPVSLWEMARYFTVTTNLVIAVLFTGLAVSPRAAAPRLIAGAALSILLVGVVYVTLLRGLLSLSGGDAVADILLHWVTPVLVPLFWLAFVPKGALRVVDPLLWIVYPLAYLAYALVRGRQEGRYAYPFLDIGTLGWERTSVTLLVMAIGFLAAGYAMVWLDRSLAPGSSAPSS